MSEMKARHPVVEGGKPLQLLFLLLSCLVATGCGIKGFPRPEQQAAPPQIKDAQAQVNPRGVELTWSIPDQLLTKSKVGSYQLVIQRAEIKWENRNCLECPAQFQDKQVIETLHPEPAVRAGNKYTWVDSNVSRDHAYRYQIGIRNVQRRIVSVSNPATAKVVATPGTVPNVTAATEGQGILLRWQRPQMDKTRTATPGQVKFLVERAPAGKTSKWETISPVPVDGGEFLDTTVASNQNYDYRVTPVLVFEETNVFGEASSVQHGRAPDTVTPPPPQSVWVIPGKGQLEVHWLESDGAPMGYHVYRRQGQEIIRLTASPLGHPPFIDQHAAKNEVYFYAVSAVSQGPHVREGLLSKWVEIRNAFFD
jgi:hypothetical protein